MSFGINLQAQTIQAITKEKKEIVVNFECQVRGEGELQKEKEKEKEKELETQKTTTENMNNRK